ncbi:nucleotidyltransferase family protein [Aquimarina algicola]|uniref:CBS domain-containing protein n=1 Tax=Aquimarina algicola TaxID=2589995 RepID=A0A504JAG1_9FLAO|nr:nucleotidyltransferase family protein [Aquimarina algicola]TPN87877.1 CBS domain-containing protein [Aquimarina algicola]
MPNSNYIINHTYTVKETLEKLNESEGRTLFVINENKELLGSVTDGDVRRALLRGINIDDQVIEVANKSVRYIVQNEINKNRINELKAENITLIPIVNHKGAVISIVDLSKKKTILPIDAVIMAGGKGTRLRPLTLDTPKPLLKVGDKPIVEYNIDRLSYFGINHLNITINYLGEQLVNYFGDGKDKEISIKYVKEDKPLGTIGSLKLVEDFHNDCILLMNSDLLTNIDFEDMYNEFLNKEGDMIIATVPYKVTIPYGVVETEGTYVTNLKEKPTYTYYSNAGIYIFKKECLGYVPNNTFFNATDLIDHLLKSNRKIINYPILGYWLDIGKHEDFEKAQEDVKHIKF